MCKIPNATVAAMHIADTDEVFTLGGVQAVAAMAVGTSQKLTSWFRAGQHGRCTLS